MTVYALTNLSDGDVEVRWEKDEKPADRDGKVWLIDPGAPTCDPLLQHAVVGPCPIPAGTTTLPYQVVDLPDAEKKNRKSQMIRSRLAPLENSITDRMWREDAVGSTTVMSNTGDTNKDGKTATQYIAWVNAEIERLRAQLAAV
jgi:hypothetical protein